MKQCLITTEKVWALHGKEGEPIFVPEGEAAKTLGVAEEVWEEMLARGLDRNCQVVGMGGGAVCDLAGFVAAGYMRGVEHVLIPTTLLAMVDAAIGGKTAVNVGGVKNAVGAMWHPKEIVIDLKYLETLPEAEMRSGFAEIIKYGVIEGGLFDELETSQEVNEALVLRCGEIKRRIVKEGTRDILNYGHTFGHAIEAVTGVRHGEALAMGMHAAAKLAQTLGMVDPIFVERQRALIEKVGLPWKAPIIALLEMMKRDKKGAMNFVLPRGFGQLELVYGVDEGLVGACGSRKSC